MLEIEDDRGTIHAEALVRERSGHVHNQLDFFSKDGWNLPASLRAQLKYDPLIAHNRHEGSPFGKYEFRRDHQTKLVPTAECYGLEVLETVNTRVGRPIRDDAPFQRYGGETSADVHWIPRRKAERATTWF